MEREIMRKFNNTDEITNLVIDEAENGMRTAIIGSKSFILNLMKSFLDDYITNIGVICIDGYIPNDILCVLSMDEDYELNVLLLDDDIAKSLVQDADIIYIDNDCGYEYSKYNLTEETAIPFWVEDEHMYSCDCEDCSECCGACDDYEDYYNDIRLDTDDDMAIVIGDDDKAVNIHINNMYGNIIYGDNTYNCGGDYL